jgi:CRP-like cAMP-binding protein
MEINLILTAQTWKLSDALQCGRKYGGVLVVKNTRAHTYLLVTPKQWQLLQIFATPSTVPKVLERIIEERLCPALGEFYELILKAVRAGVLVEAMGVRDDDPVPALNWPVALKPAKWTGVLWFLLAAGIGLTAYFSPDLPLSWQDALAGAGFLAIGVMLGAALSASLVRGMGGEVYSRRGWLLNNVDACMHSPADQRAAVLGSIAPLAAITGALAWQRPEWSFIPLVGLVIRLRPILGGSVSRVLRAGAEKRLADAEHDFLFPPNRTARQRGKLLRRGLSLPTTWMEIFYAAIWTLALGRLVSEMTEVSPWRLAFWQEHGLRLGGAFFGSLFLLGLVYGGLEIYVFVRERALARHETLRLFWRRWFGRGKVATDEASRMRAIMASALLRQLPPATQQALSRSLKPEMIGAWQTLHTPDAPVDRFSLVLSGKVGVYRRNAVGRRVLVQVLCENDLVGLHAAGDPERPEFVYRTLTPVLLLRADWAFAEEHIVGRFPAGAIANLVQKTPFLSRISLCQYWHRQSIQRFAELTRVVSYSEGQVILRRGFFSEYFYIVFEGQARILVKDREVGRINAENFFGEIGLLQNSSATAQVVAGPGTRCLCIPRQEFLRFVAHNYAVALKLERVSSVRLGHPIFPLSPGNFRTI